MPAGRTLTLATSPRPGAACLAGPHRLAELGPLLRFARGLRVYSAAAGPRSLPMPSAWELDLGTARFTLTLSPEHYRGFTGEGALLGLLADPGAAADADMVGALLAWDARIDAGRLAARAGFPAERVTAALTYLAARGRVGYDLAEESFFHRRAAVRSRARGDAPAAGQRPGAGLLRVGRGRPARGAGPQRRHRAPGHVRRAARHLHLSLVGQAPGHPRAVQARPRGPDGCPVMSLDPEQLAAAIRRDDATGVRALLLDATEADRRECTRALRSLLDGPDFRADAAGRLVAEWNTTSGTARPS